MLKPSIEFFCPLNTDFKVSMTWTTVCWHIVLPRKHTYKVLSLQFLTRPSHYDGCTVRAQLWASDFYLCEINCYAASLFSFLFNIGRYNVLGCYSEFLSTLSCLPCWVVKKKSAGLNATDIQIQSNLGVTKFSVMKLLTKQIILIFIIWCP